MVASILGSMRALFWAVMLYMMVVYAVGVLFTEIITAHRSIKAGNEQDLLDKYFGSMYKAVVTLYACISGGVGWGDLVKPLSEEISGWMVPMLILFILFCTLCLMNVVTGIFLETAMARANEDQSIDITSQVLNLFKTCQLNEIGEITWGTFESLLSTKQMREMFTSINVDPREAHKFFNLIDVDGKGSVNPHELLDGWLRLKGPAKSLDLATLMVEVEHAFADVRGKLDALVNDPYKNSAMSAYTDTSRPSSKNVWVLRRSTTTTKFPGMRAPEKRSPQVSQRNTKRSSQRVLVPASNETRPSWNQAS